MAFIDDTGVCSHFNCGIGATHPFDAVPVGCGTMRVKKATFCEKEGSCAYARRQIGMLILLRNPVEKSSVVPLATCSLTSRNEKNVERRSILNGNTYSASALL